MKNGGVLLIMIACLACPFYALAQNLYKVHDAPVPNITVPQVQAQVVTPQVFAQLGSQDRALQDIDREIGEVKTDVSALKADVKPLQETDIRVRFILSILEWLLSIILASGLGGWFIHWLHQRSKRKGKPIQAGSLGT